ncbi:MAG: HAMP domain-containing sensor histidine kinase [Flavobacteriales bacterium]|nr:HAMP domain-containing sensor histidine kinase [Flavobacteriales bacterium]
MSRRAIFTLILLALLSLTAITVFQVFFTQRAYSFNERLFNFRVTVAMTSVVNRILSINSDPALTEPVKQISNNYFVANINDTPQPYLLETLLREEFQKSHLTEDFEYGIYDCFNDSIVFGSRVQFDQPLGEVRQEEVSLSAPVNMDGHYFVVHFPGKATTILKELEVQKYSSMLMILIICFFGYTIFIILRQKRLSEIKTDFINNMTHELKTPISTISLSADGLSNPAVYRDEERLKNYVAIIKSESDRLRGQVEKVLQLATLAPRKANLKMERLNVHEVIQKAAATISMSVDQAGGCIETNLEAANAVIMGDSVHITNLVYNLLDNALKYTEKEPLIKIKTRNAKGNIFITVEDNGIGMRQSQIKMIFDKFYRVPTGDLHNVKGFGLGLFYVKSIVKAHKGHIEVESKPGRGSAFTISFKSSI